EFRKTRHFHACWTPEVGPMPPGFTAEKASYDSTHPGLRFRMSQTEAGFYQTASRGSPQGQQPLPLRIDLVYGSGGQADEVYSTWKDDRLFELPVGWLHPTSQWADQSYDPNNTRDFTRTTTPRCLECHNTWIEHVPGSENQYRRDTFLRGVT